MGRAGGRQPPEARGAGGMSEGKWFSDVAANTPLADAARYVLRSRLEVVEKYLELLAKAETEDPEDIHQLRVSSRRAAAALDMFASCLPSKVHSKAKKKLKRLRRAAGAARDWDVFLDSIRSRGISTAARRAGLDLVVGYALGQRRAARIQSEATARDYSKSFAKFAEHVLLAIHRHVNHVKLQTLSSLPPTALFPLVRALDEAADQDLTDSGNLHQVRIAGKRLRYAMEILASCFAPPFREELYPAIEAMQDILGRANDSRFAIARLEDLRGNLEKSRLAGWKRKQAALTEFSGYHQRRLTQERRRFERWWKNWKVSGGEQAFVSLVHAPVLILS
jgi:CHAD domain-containing protein